MITIFPKCSRLSLGIACCEIHVRTLIIVGRYDWITPIDQSQYMAIHIPGGSENEMRRYSSASGPEMMRRYQASLEEVAMTHEELRRQFQLLDAYVELVRIREPVEIVEGQIVDKLLG